MDFVYKIKWKLMVLRGQQKKCFMFIDLLPNKWSLNINSIVFIQKKKCCNPMIIWVAMTSP